MREAVIASAVRTAVGKAPKGTLRATRPDDLAAVAIKGALERVPELDAAEVEDVIIGCAMPEAEQGMNVARIASLRAGVPIQAAAMTINRFCASGLQSIALAAERIRSGGAEVIVAGGAESMSFVPMGGNKVSINPWLEEHYPDSYNSMGLTAEQVAQRCGITREAADQFSVVSHQRALAAQREGKFEVEIVPVPVVFKTVNSGTKPHLTELMFRVDEGPRTDTSLAALAKLKPAFGPVNGSLTAGSSWAFADGASSVLLASEKLIAEQGWTALARFVDAESAAVNFVGGEGLLMAPTIAVSELLKRNNLKLRISIFMKSTKPLLAKFVYAESLGRYQILQSNSRTIRAIGWDRSG